MVALRPAQAGAHRVEDRVGVVGCGVERVEATSELLLHGSNSKSSVILAPTIRGAQPDRVQVVLHRPLRQLHRGRDLPHRELLDVEERHRDALLPGKAAISVREVAVGRLRRRDLGRGLAREPGAGPAGAFLPTEVVAQAVERDVADPARGRVVPGDAPPARIGAGEGVLHRIGGRLPVAARSRE